LTGQAAGCIVVIMTEQDRAGPHFADRVVEAQKRKASVVVLGIDPQLDDAAAKGLPPSYELGKFCCEIVEACAPWVVAAKLQLAFFEARGLEGMRVFAEVAAFARGRGLLTIADAKRADVAHSAAAYAEAFLGSGELGCDAVTVNPYLGRDGVEPFLQRARADRGVFVLVRTSNPSAAEFQDLAAAEGALWEIVARKVADWGAPFVGQYGLSSVGAVVGATYPEQARRARQLMPRTLVLAPGYGAQGASAEDATAGARADGLGLLVNASRSLMYAWRQSGLGPGQAAALAAEKMRRELQQALAQSQTRAPAR
jgi:orotidine-5'-phosphate decarboxylase